MLSKLPNRRRANSYFLLAAVCFAFSIVFTLRSSSRTQSQDSHSVLASSALCLSDLLLKFRIEDSVLHLSAPIYVRLSKPKSVGAACLQKLIGSDAVKNPTAMELHRLSLLSTDEQSHIYRIVHQLHSNFSQMGLELFLAGGSLLGSWRHLGFIPWDADIDFMIQYNQKPLVRQFLVNLSKSEQFNFIDTELTNQHWQLGILCGLVGQNLSARKQCKTIVDFFFGRVKGRVYDRQEAPRKFPIDYVYPLRVRPFGPYLLPAPNQPDRFLTAVYGRDFQSNCLFKYFNHMRTDCSYLSKVHSFVRRLQLTRKGKIIQAELLMKNDQILALFLPEPEGSNFQRQDDSWRE
ncbi:hypothetical protein BOX15_Mlig031085g1 [Macrostomum lignano]|uniref:LicD/FKTN/FKRP nucleotidyltransferase domain-containing protein n=1 Tax=Macrostomum lignano TaxID=282301 RepID=A0A267G693_9PLAT|nr:hypothetical protein BOX15_Mlig031085g1 [Macrostomum lignano]